MPTAPPWRPPIGPRSSPSGRGILTAAPRCIARWGTAKTTLDDIAREAGCSRASIYRAFPGGKEQVLEAAMRYDEGRFFGELSDRLSQAPTLEDLLVVGLNGAARFIGENEALQYLLVHEPEVVLPHLAFDRAGPMLYRVAAFAGPYLERFLDEAVAAEIAEWVTRLVLSYTLHPSEHFDLRDEAHARRFVRTYVLPACSNKGESHVIH